MSSLADMFSSGTPTADIQASWGSFYPGGYSPIHYMPFDGERNAGQAGPINKYILDNVALSLRSWQMLLESELVQIGISRLAMWEIGSGLKLRCEPDKNVLKASGINLDTQQFSKQIESLFNLYAGSPISDRSGMESLHKKIYQAKKN